MLPGMSSFASHSTAQHKCSSRGRTLQPARELASLPWQTRGTGSLSEHAALPLRPGDAFPSNNNDQLLNGVSNCLPESWLK